MARAAYAVGALCCVALAALAVLADPASARGDGFTVTSPALADGGRIPVGFTCDGAEVSLPLAWRRVPKGTKELALIMDDPDAPTGTFVHWVAWGITPTARRLPKAAAPDAVQEGKPGYIGPCPPHGDGVHHYRITMYALDAPPGVTPGVATASDLRAAIRDHVLAKDRIVGTYER